MLKKHNFLHAVIAVLVMIFVLFPFWFSPAEVHAAPSIGFVILNSYSRTMKIGDEYYLIAATSNGKKPTFTSSNSSVASVNTYGKITAKKAGTAKIRAKITTLPHPHLACQALSKGQLHCPYAYSFLYRLYRLRALKLYNF